MSRLVPKKYKVLKGINNILVFKLVEVSRNGTRNFFVYNINIIVYIFGRIIVITITDFKQATSRLVPIKRIKVGNYKY